MEIDIVQQQFREKFGDAPSRVYASPGRVNLIGEHTDYNGSFVFPGAIDKGMVAVIRANGTKKGTCLVGGSAGSCRVHHG